MAHLPDDWEKPRSKGQKLSAADIALLKTSFKAGHSPREAARAIKCSSRVAYKYYVYFRNERDAPAPKRPQPSMPTLPTLPTLPRSRFYKSSFDL